MGPNLDRLLTSYWDQRRIVPNTGKFLGKDFRTVRGLIQGDPASPMIFNTVVDAVVWAVLNVVYRPQEDHNGLGWAAGKRNLIFYSDDGRIEGQDHKRVQDSLSVKVEMFRRMGLEKPQEYQDHGMHTMFHLGELRVASLQETGNRRRGNVSGKEEVTGKLHRVRSDVRKRFPQTAHDDPKRHLRPPDEGGRRERVGTNHLCGVLTQVNRVGKVSGTGLSHGSTQCGKTAGKFHVTTISVFDRGVPKGKGTAAPLRLVRNAHDSGEDHQLPPDSTMQPEYAYEVAETGCGNRGKVHRGDLQSHRGGWSGVF